MEGVTIPSFKGGIRKTGGLAKYGKPPQLESPWRNWQAEDMGGAGVSEGRRVGLSFPPVIVFGH